MLARIVLITHAAFLILMLWLLAVTGQPDPVHILPESAFGVTSFATRLLTLLPWLIAIPIVALLYYAYVQWGQKWWKTGFKIHYTIYSLFSAGLVWLFFYFNLLSF